MYFNDDFEGGYLWKLMCIHLMKLVTDKFESRIFSKKYQGKNKREFIKLDQDFTMSQLQDQIIQLKESINKDEVIRIQNELIMLRA